MASKPFSDSEVNLSSSHPTTQHVTPLTTLSSSVPGLPFPRREGTSYKAMTSVNYFLERYKRPDAPSKCWEFGPDLDSSSLSQVSNLLSVQCTPENSKEFKYDNLRCQVEIGSCGTVQNDCGVDECAEKLKGVADGNRDFDRVESQLKEREADLGATCSGNSKLSLECFLQELSETEAKYPNSPESCTIRENVETMLENLCDYLRENHKMFENCRLLKTGSTYEGLKIGDPDEFDFMIEIPALADDTVVEYFQEVFEVFGSQLVHYRVKNKALFEDILRKQSEKEDNGDLMSNVFNALEEIISNQLQNSMLPRWQFCMDPKLTHTGRLIPKIAVTPVFKWSGEEFKFLYVSIDIAYAIPLHKRPLWDLNRFKQMGLNSKDREMKLPDSPKVCYALLRNSETCRMSFSLEEQQTMKQFPLTSGQNKCLRLLKYFRNVLSMKTFDSSSLELKSGISTYWLKTIMYFQYAKYEKDPSKWDNGSLSERMTEALQELLLCINNSVLYSFFIPCYNLFSFLFPHKAERDTVIRDIEEILQVLESLQSGCIRKEDFQSLVKVKQVADDSVVYQGRRTYLIDLLYIYAYNDYDSYGLETIQGYIARHLKDTIELQGEGQNILLLDHGEKVDIDKELEKVYGDKFSYFK